MENAKHTMMRKIFKKNNIHKDSQKSIFSLGDVTKGSQITIHRLPSTDTFKVQLIRLGIMEGSTVDCIEKLPGGTIVIKKNRQEIAIGSDLARRIQVSLN